MDATNVRKDDDVDREQGGIILSEGQPEAVHREVPCTEISTSYSIYHASSAERGQIILIRGIADHGWQKW